MDLANGEIDLKQVLFILKYIQKPLHVSMNVPEKEYFSINGYLLRLNVTKV